MSGSSPAERQRGPRRLPSGADGPSTSRPLTLLAIVGPTGTGKTALAIEVARRVGGEIIGCDALQVYRGFNAATAKPTSEERRAVPHHLIDVVEPNRDFSMADYVRRAELCLEEIHARGRVPLVVGGTGLYLRGLLHGVLRAPERNPRLRERLRALAERHGAEALHRRLRGLDGKSAERIAPRDLQRVIRAFELALRGERPWSERLEHEGAWSDGQERYRALKVVLTAPRPWLVDRLDRRARAFFADGLVAEVRGLLARGVPAEANAFKAIGYREVLAALRGGEDPEAALEIVQRNTRRYAKRQRTWFRREPGIVELEAPRGPRQLAEEILVRWTALQQTAANEGEPAD